MRLRHNHLRTGAFAKRMARAAARLVLVLVGVLILAGPWLPSARAQFSGPALSAATPINPPVTITTDPSILYPANRDVYLDEGDLITVRLYASVDYNPSSRIDLDGNVILPLIGKLKLEGLSVHQAQDLIAERLVSAGIYRDPQVSILITESPNAVATLVGEIHGIVPIVGQRRLYEVLALSGGTGGGGGTGTTVIVSGGGGLPPTASHVITINRPGEAQPIVVDLGTDPAKSSLANIPIFPKDTIVVPRVGVVYLLGAFKIQGAIPLQQNSPMTLMKVAALAGGPGFEGKNSDLRIIRSTGLTRQVVRVDIKKVINGKAPDPVLQAEDIVFLPSSAMKAAIKEGGIGTLLGIVSLLVVFAQH
jgi:polysaccharide biosynthesis/export protein